MSRKISARVRSREYRHILPSRKVVMESVYEIGYMQDILMKIAREIDKDAEWDQDQAIALDSAGGIHVFYV